jgi:hypothetical protein
LNAGNYCTRGNKRLKTNTNLPFSYTGLAADEQQSKVQRMACLRIKLLLDLYQVKIAIMGAGSANIIFKNANIRTVF